MGTVPLSPSLSRLPEYKCTATPVGNWLIKFGFLVEDNSVEARDIKVPTLESQLTSADSGMRLLICTDTKVFTREGDILCRRRAGK